VDKGRDLLLLRRTAPPAEVRIVRQPFRGMTRTSGASFKKSLLPVIVNILFVLRSSVGVTLYRRHTPWKVSVGRTL
jgi:hypothetical protein